MKIREGRGWFWRRSINLFCISHWKSGRVEVDFDFFWYQYICYRYRNFFFQYQRCILQIKVIILHLFDFSPLYVYKCVLKSPASEEAYSHWLHLFDLIPLCLFMCPLKSLGPGTRVQWLKLWKWGVRWPARLVMRRAPAPALFQQLSLSLMRGNAALLNNRNPQGGHDDVAWWITDSTCTCDLWCKYLQTFALFVVYPS